jgi:hypothetical protein
VLAFLVFLALLGVAAALLTIQLVDNDGGNGGNGGSGGDGGETSNGVTQAITSIVDYDPFGDNREENPSQVGLAVDGFPDTAWHSEFYNTRDFGNAKPGVGLVLNLSTETDVSAVEIDANAGYDVAIYVADEAAATLAGWGQPRAKASDLGADARVDLSPSARGRVVLVWFTRLPESGRLDVAELRVR